MLCYYWVLATPAVGWLFACYLYVCVNWFGVHYDEVQMVGNPHQPPLTSYAGPPSRGLLCATQARNLVRCIHLQHQPPH